MSAEISKRSIHRHVGMEVGLVNDSNVTEVSCTAGATRVRARFGTRGSDKAKQYFKALQ